MHNFFYFVFYYIVNHSICDTTMLTSVHTTVLKEYNIGIISEVDTETLRMIYIELSAVNEKKHQVVNIDPRNYTVVLQGRVPFTTTIFTSQNNTATQISTTSISGTPNISLSVHCTTKGLAVTTLRTTENTKASTFVILSSVPVISVVSPNDQGKCNLFVILFVVIALIIGILIGMVIGCAFCYVQRRIWKSKEIQFLTLNNKGHEDITNGLSEATFLVKDKGDIDGDENEDNSLL